MQRGDNDPFNAAGPNASPLNMTDTCVSRVKKNHGLQKVDGVCAMKVKGVGTSNDRAIQTIGIKSIEGADVDCSAKHAQPRDPTHSIIINTFSNVRRQCPSEKRRLERLQQSERPRSWSSMTPPVSQKREPRPNSSSCPLFLSFGSVILFVSSALSATNTHNPKSRRSHCFSSWQKYLDYVFSD